MAHLRDIRTLTLEGAKAMEEAAERLAMVGAIGVSGMNSAQDAEVTAAGVAAFRGNP
jgi:uncharacterized protein GlcG (DUF336 family)